jgi:hypothetical protein
MNEVGLRLRRPHRPAGSVCVTEPRSVECDHAIFFRREINQTATEKIIDHAAVAVQQD